MTNEPRQRWRLVVARDAAARDLVHRDVAAAWEAGLRASGLPLSMSEGATPKPRISFAAPAPVGALAERELIDVVVTELLLVSDVRAAVAAAAPIGYRSVDLYDVWLGSPSLASLVIAGDYRATVAGDTALAGAATLAGAGLPASTGVAGEPGAGLPASAEIEAAIGALLAAPHIERARTRGRGDALVDIRPHLRRLRLVGAPSTIGGVPATEVGSGPGGSGPGASFELWMRLRLGGEGGVGRPEEVVAALGDGLGQALVAQRIVRERIVLTDDEDVGRGE